MNDAILCVMKRPKTAIARSRSGVRIRGSFSKNDVSQPISCSWEGGAETVADGVCGFGGSSSDGRIMGLGLGRGASVSPSRLGEDRG